MSGGVKARLCRPCVKSQGASDSAPRHELFRNSSSEPLRGPSPCRKPWCSGEANTVRSRRAPRFRNFTKWSPAFDPDDRRAVGRIGHLLLDERMLRELVSDSLAHRARAPAVDDAHLVAAGERGLVDEVTDGLARLLCGAPA